MGHETNPTGPESAHESAHDIPVDIGNETYLLTENSLQFLDGGHATKYEKEKSVLILEEPHYDVEAQFNLYKFLESFFTDYPSLIPQTAFLAEGHPANQPISVQPLIDLEPNPSDRLIYETLSSFLITGYMAYEWKYQYGIPIVGTEDHFLYKLSSRIWPPQIDETVSLWELSVVARNKSMAEVLSGATSEFENPILFVGGKHMIDKISDEAFKGMGNLKPEDFMTNEEMTVLKGFKNMAIDDYLRRGKIGYSFFRAFGETLREQELYISIYATLLVAQQTGRYQEYIDWLLDERGYRVTSGPSPEGAAEFAKVLVKKRSENPEVARLADEGFEAERKEKYIEAAENYSAASAAEPNVPGYLYSIQRSLIKEVKHKILRLQKTSGKKDWSLNPEEPTDLPIFGPYIKENHHEIVDHFAGRFAKIPGFREVINNALSTTWAIRFGGIFQIETAEAIGPEIIRSFEEKSRALSGGIQRVDIATKQNIAVECKNFTDPNPRTRQIWGWVEQAVSRLQNKQYKNILIVIPDEANIRMIQESINADMQRYYQGFSDRIKMCRMSETRNILNKMKGWW